MQTDLMLMSPLVTLVRWTERPGRPITSASTDSADGCALRAGALLDELLTPSARDQLSALTAGATHTASAPSVIEDLCVTSQDAAPRFFHATITREDSGAGEPTFAAVLVDVTAQQAANAQLQERSERLALVIDSNRLGTWDWNPQTNEVTFGDHWAEMLGYEAHEISSSLHEWEDRVHPDDLEACFKDINAHIDGEVDYYENVHRMQHKDGHWVHILDRGRIIKRDAEGRPVHFTGTHTDISVQKLSELKAQKAADVKSQFLATMSHEIRTPITGILGMLQMLDGTALDLEQRELLRTVNMCGDHLLVLVDDILNLAKIEAGELSVMARPFPLDGVVQTLRGMHGKIAESKGLEFSTAVSRELPEWLVSDSHRLIQLLSNLISNAIKFTPRGHVKLTFAAEHNHDESFLRVTVSDSGNGIQNTETIWERFAQEDAQISRKHGGSGLGLAISRQITQMLGGSITVESAPGEGSTFLVRIPFEPADLSQMVMPDSGLTGANRFEGLNVLIVDDNEINQRVIQSMCRKLRVLVDHASDGLEATEKCSQKRYDVVLMDIHMPGMDGLEATQLIGEQQGEDAPPIYAITADVLAESKQRCMDAGMRDVIEKPVRAKKIIKVLDKVLSKCAKDIAS